jgi:hypothetical protein
MLASDLNNPEFAGPQNPDSLLQIEFYDHAAEDTWKSEETGVKSFRAECPYIRISIPGNKNTTVERPADGRDIKRFPNQWLFYQMQTGKIADAHNVPGTKLEDWLELDKEIIRQLTYLRFYTVEQIAGANDAQIQGIGMGGNGLRERAKAFLKERQGAAVNTEMKARDNEIAALKEQMAKLMDMLQNQAPIEPAPAVEAVRRGRKPKSEQANA